MSLEVTFYDTTSDTMQANCYHLGCKMYHLHLLRKITDMILSEDNIVPEFVSAYSFDLVIYFSTIIITAVKASLDREGPFSGHLGPLHTIVAASQSGLGIN